MYYRAVSVRRVQQGRTTCEEASIEDLLTSPLGNLISLAPDHIQAELDCNAQGTIGHGMPRVAHGVGCTKVPDINDVGLMEDRATLRISRQHVANCLVHGVCRE